MNDKNTLLKIIKSNTKLNSILPNPEIQFYFPATFLLFTLFSTAIFGSFVFEFIGSLLITYLISSFLLIVLGLLYFKDYIQIKYFRNKLKAELKMVENQEELYLILINKMDETTIRKNLRKIIKYSIRNSLYDEMTVSLSDKNIDYKEILKEITKNKVLFGNYIKSIPTLSALEFYFDSEVESLMDIPKKDIINIQESVILPLVREYTDKGMIGYRDEISILLSDLSSLYLGAGKINKLDEVNILRRKIRKNRVDDDVHGHFKQKTLKKEKKIDINNGFVGKEKQEVGF